MKKVLLFIITLLLFISPIYASTNTYTRTKENLRVGNYINVSSFDEYYIMNTPSVDETEKVYDFADLYSNSEEEELYKKIGEFINKYDMDMVIVTIDNNNKTSSMEYADDFYDYNLFGTGTDQSGMLLLLDMDYRKIYISTTGYAIRMYSDIRIESMLDDIYYHMADGNYFDASTKYIESASTFAEEGLPSDDLIQELTSTIVAGIILKAMGISAVVTAIVMAILIFMNRMIKKATNASNYINKESININEKSDRFTGTHTTSVTISSSSSGGSSIHSGSSGVSHGGGGRRF